MPRSRTRSAYSPQEPPPLEAPPQVVEVVAWQIASRNWCLHVPDALLGVQCDSCGEHWPCDAWHVADDVITDCLEESQMVRRGEIDATLTVP